MSVIKFWEHKFEVENCPFCGGEPEGIIDEHMNSDTTHNVFIKCEKCGTSMRQSVSGYEPDKGYRSFKKLVDKWNHAALGGKTLSRQQSSDNEKSKPKKVYISGAITNNPHYKEQFAEAEAKLKAEGYEVINPAKNQGYTYKEYIDLGLFELMHCDAIYMLEGWENSTGAKLEYEYAVAVGLEVMGCKTQHVTKIHYLLGEAATLVFDTGYVPEAIPWMNNDILMDISDNHITMCVELHKKGFQESKHKIFMTAEQAKSMRKALKMQVERLGLKIDEEV